MKFFYKNISISVESEYAYIFYEFFILDYVTQEKFKVQYKAHFLQFFRNDTLSYIILAFKFEFYMNKKLSLKKKDRTLLNMLNVLCSNIKVICLHVPMASFIIPIFLFEIVDK